MKEFEWPDFEWIDHDIWGGRRSGLKARIWNKLSVLAGWVTFWRNGHTS
jgi:hypothetical protein